jgi:hypothetical protein
VDALRDGLRDVDLWRGLEASPRGDAAGRTHRRALRDQAVALARGEDLVQPRAAWRIVPLDSDPGTSGGLCAGGHRLEAPWLLPASGRLTAIACAVATIGDAIERCVASLFTERRAALALALDEVANDLLFALSRRVQDHLLAAVRRQGLTMAGELRAGDPGLALQEQPAVLALAGAESVGITLAGTLMMHPAKSTSIVHGVGHALPAVSWSRCDRCRSRSRCRVAQAAAA